MKNHPYLILIGAIGAGLLLGACAATTQSAPTLAAAVTDAPTWTPASPTEEPTLEPSATSTVLPTEVVVLDYCVACHTDQDQLITTAKVEEVVEKESEGVG